MYLLIGLVRKLSTVHYSTALNSKVLQYSISKGTRGIGVYGKFYLIYAIHLNPLGRVLFRKKFLVGEEVGGE